MCGRIGGRGFVKVSTVDEVAHSFQTALRCALVESPKEIKWMVLHSNKALHGFVWKPGTAGLRSSPPRWK